MAILTEKIVYLTKHMQQHPHDYHSRRGLITMVNKRRRWVVKYGTAVEKTPRVSAVRPSVGAGGGEQASPRVRDVRSAAVPTQGEQA